MAIEITMPALSPTMEEGNLAKWLVKEGDKVSAGDVLAEIETDKATMEVETIDDGIVSQLLVPAGSAGVKVNQVIAILTREGEDMASVVMENVAVVAPSAVEEKIELEQFPKSVKRLRIKNCGEKQTVEKQISDSIESHSALTPVVSIVKNEDKSKRVFASPLARRLSKDAGIALEMISGSGPHGRIIADDVKAVIATGAKAAKAVAKAPSSVVPGDDDGKILQLFRNGDYDLQPHDLMRKTIARRLVQSKQHVPHFYVAIDCLLDNLLKLRAEVNEAAPLVETETGKQPAYKLSVNDFVIKAVALALKTHPDANVSWTEAAMIRHKFVDVGVAVSIPGGLMTPIVTQAEQKSLTIIAAEMKDLAARARARKLKPEEYQGGSTAVSNMGMYGVKSFAAIINPPQSTIFAIGSGEQRPIVKDGALVAATMMSVTISADHRAVDGALAAELSQTFKHFIENPISMLV